MKIIITSGDTNGIGLETFFKGFPAVEQSNNEFALCTNIETLEEYAEKSNLNISIKGTKATYMNRTVDLVPLDYYSEIMFGKTTQMSGKHSSLSVETALDLTLSGEYDAMVTLPISKEAVHMAGWEYPGHTEMLADKCDVKNPLMILFKDRIRVAIVTIHIPLSEVSNKLSKQLIQHKIIDLNSTLKNDFGVIEPKIAVLGLNPHAGENGNIGTEEIKFINESVDELYNDGLDVSGPFAADGYFAHGAYFAFDATLAMYHDQGLIPMKMLARGGGVNYTGCLPIVRTSPDHGTAFTIAGKGQANPQSTIDSINAAIEIAKFRRNTCG